MRISMNMYSSNSNVKSNAVDLLQIELKRLRDELTFVNQERDEAKKEMLL